MIFRQLFHHESSTYTYLLACKKTFNAVLIDPVQDNLEQYLGLLEQLELKLVYALDTHIHADHITALGDLRDRTGCVSVMGASAVADCVSKKVDDGEVLQLGNLGIRCLSTPGHTIESFSYLVEGMVFTGDVLLIRGSGRTDFQGGNAGDSFDSIHNKLFTLPDSTLVYPGHDYKGMTCSSIGEEKRHNPRLAGTTREEYIAIMNNLDLPDPKMMDLAVPANTRCGKTSGNR